VSGVSHPERGAATESIRSEEHDGAEFDTRMNDGPPIGLSSGNARARLAQQGYPTSFL
jgi:hypothetical protein